MNELLETIADALDLSSITEDAKAGDPEAWDSLGHLRIILAVESKYGVQFKTEIIPTLDSATSLWDAINGHTQES